MDKCFACDRRLGKSPKLVDTRDSQTVYVGSECFKLIAKAGETGYQPPLGGPRLYPMPTGCDCENPEPAQSGAAGVSEFCPIHNNLSACDLANKNWHESADLQPGK